MMPGISAACREAREDLVADVADAGRTARAQRHRLHCAQCAADAERSAAMVAAVRAGQGRALDDVARERIAGRIDLSVDDLASLYARRAARVPRQRWWLAFGAVAAAAAVLAWISREPESPPRPQPRATLEVLRVDSTPRSRIEVAPGRKVRATIGDRAALTVSGPARVSVVEAHADSTTLALDSGLLIGDYDHDRGGDLHIQARGVRVDIVGTLFAIDARDESVRVAVARGAVEVTSASGRVRVAAGQSWSAGARQSMPADLAELLGTPVPIARPATPRPARVVAVAPAPAPQPVAPCPQPVALEPPAEPTPPPQPTVPVAQPKPVVPDDLYERAESALRAGHRAAAKSMLRELAHRPGAAADQALYDLSLLLERDGEVAEARSNLDQLLAHGAQSPVFEAARYLRCRVEVDARAYLHAAACLEAFRRDFPRSPHDAESLAALASFAQADGDCATARRLLREYLDRYSRGPFAREAQARFDRCGR